MGDLSQVASSHIIITLEKDSPQKIRSNRIIPIHAYTQERERERERERDDKKYHGYLSSDSCAGTGFMLFRKN